MSDIINFKALVIVPPLILLTMPAGVILASAQLSPMQAACGNTTQTVTPNSTTTADSNITTPLSNSTSSTFTGEKSPFYNRCLLDWK